jgi:hypothetical protein
MQDILSDQYKREIAYQKLRYETDKQSRIRSEYENNLRIRKELEEERVKNYINKKNIAEKQYNDYMKGLEARQEKRMREIEEKMKPTAVSLQLGSEENLKAYHDKLTKLSNRADRNSQLYNEYNEKNKQIPYYNYLTKRYSISKEINRTLPDEKEFINFRNDNFDDYNKSVDPNFYGKKEYFNFEGNKRDGTDVTNKYFYDKYFNPTYQTYKEVNKDYEDYNRNVINQNIKFKEEMLDRKKFEEEERKKEREKLISLQQLQKIQENDMKKQYKEELDQQIVDQVPMKLENEGYLQNALKSSTPNFQNEFLYREAPDYSLINKSKFVEVNPYNRKRYDLGESNLEYNPLIKPGFNFRYNKYLVPVRMIREKSSPILQSNGANTVYKEN